MRLLGLTQPCGDRGSLDPAGDPKAWHTRGVGGGWQAPS
jgi:hypothetical protein